MVCKPKGQVDVPFDVLGSFRALDGLPSGLVAEIEEVIRIARRFNEEVVKQRHLVVDLQVQQDPDYLPNDLVEEASRWSFYTMWLPKVIGGQGFNPISLPFFCEEIASTCVTMANLIAVHYLGMVGLTLSINYRLSLKIAQEIIDGASARPPVLCAFAITEPNAGTDTQYAELMDRGRVGCHAQRVEGGYRINGTKVFISNGHFSTWNIVFAYSDLKNPSQSIVIFAVKTGNEGFSAARREKKMGQKGCPASELVFADCFIPDDQICFDFNWLSEKERKAAGENSAGFSAAQGNVGAFSAGLARGAFQDAVEFAAETEMDGHRLIDQEWVQCHLANMYTNASIARMAFMDGVFALLQTKTPQKYFSFNKYFPHSLVRSLVFPLLTKRVSEWVRKKIVRGFKTRKRSNRRPQMGDLVAGTGSLAKVTASDLAVKNCQLAIELMGRAGVRHDKGVEKRLRDSRLLQIYEGTNQMNRLNIFKHLIAPHFADVSMYEK